MFTDSQDAVIQDGDFKKENSQLILNEEFDFAACSLVEVVMAVESNSSLRIN